MNTSEVMRETVHRKSSFVYVPPSVVEQNVKRKPEIDRAELVETASLEQLTDVIVKSSNNV